MDLIINIINTSFILQSQEIPYKALFARDVSLNFPFDFPYDL